jgi:hypothetical protein
MSQAPETPGIKYPWQQAVLEAFMEFRTDVLLQKINQAQRAVATRLRDNTPADAEEQLAIRDALQSLRMLIAEQRDTLARRRPDKKPDKEDIA